jgi:hypothetical protein
VYLRLQTTYPSVPSLRNPSVDPFVKLNIGWNFFRKRQYVGVGSIAKDHTRVILGAFCVEIPGHGVGLHRADSERYILGWRQGSKS